MKREKNGRYGARPLQSTRTFAIVAAQHMPEVRDGVPEPFCERDPRLVPEQLARPRQIRPTTHRIVLRQRLVIDPDVDAVVLELPMEPVAIFSPPEVEANRGQVAFRRGPLVHCLEKPDAAGLDLEKTVIDLDRRVPSGGLTARFDDALGMIVLDGRARERGAATSRDITLIPFYARANREGDTRWLTWIPYE